MTPETSEPPAATRQKPVGNAPYCGKCGYTLTGLTESSKCPECGLPLVEVLMRPGPTWRGQRKQSSIMLFGLPLYSIAFGPDGAERIGHARGIIAIGDVATGWLAMGGRARGIIALGGMAVGVVAMGGLAIGVIALGGGAIGLIACGGAAIGGIATGGGAAGYIASGGAAVGYYAHGGGAFGVHTISALGRDPEAVRFFRDLSWLFGRNLSSPLGLATFAGWIVAAILTVAVGLGVTVLAGLRLRASTVK